MSSAALGEPAGAKSVNTTRRGSSHSTVAGKSRGTSTARTARSRAGRRSRGRAPGGRRRARRGGARRVWVAARRRGGRRGSPSRRRAPARRARRRCRRRRCRRRPTSRGARRRAGGLAPVAGPPRSCCRRSARSSRTARAYAGAAAPREATPARARATAQRAAATTDVRGCVGMAVSRCTGRRRPRAQRRLRQFRTAVPRRRRCAARAHVTTGRVGPPAAGSGVGRRGGRRPLGTLPPSTVRRAMPRAVPVSRAPKPTPAGSTPAPHRHVGRRSTRAVQYRPPSRDDRSSGGDGRGSTVAPVHPSSVNCGTADAAPTRIANAASATSHEE
jgi:hypothetical protein